MNLIGYDAMAVGNHEFDFGVERLDASQRQSKFPWLSANTLALGDRQAFPPYRRSGDRRACASGSWASSPPARRTGSARRCSAACASSSPSPSRNTGSRSCATRSAATSSSSSRTRASSGTRRPERIAAGSASENQAYALATEVPGVDLVLSGHAHVVVNPQRVGARLGLGARALGGDADALRRRVREAGGGGDAGGSPTCGARACR